MSFTDILSPSMIASFLSGNALAEHDAGFFVGLGILDDRYLVGLRLILRSLPQPLGSDHLAHGVCDLLGENNIDHLEANNADTSFDQNIIKAVY